MKQHNSIAGISALRSVCIGLIFLAVLATSFIGIHRFSKGEINWAEENGWLLTGTILVTGTAFLHASMYWSWKYALGFLFCSLVVGALAEWSGVHLGFPFGVRYDYHDDLTPRVFGVVPLFVPLAWFTLLYAPLIFLDLVPTRYSGRERTAVKIFLAALLVMATDLYLDPLAVESGVWTWAETGLWFGVPLLNFAGWWMVGGVVYGVFLPWMNPTRDFNSRELKRLRWVNLVAVVCLGSAALYCLIQRIESGWMALASGLALVVPVAGVWYSWGRRE